MYLVFRYRILLPEYQLTLKAFTVCHSVVCAFILPSHLQDLYRPHLVFNIRAMELMKRTQKSAEQKPRSRDQNFSHQPPTQIAKLRFALQDRRDVPTASGQCILSGGRHSSPSFCRCYSPGSLWRTCNSRSTTKPFIPIGRRISSRVESSALTPRRIPSALRRQAHPMSLHRKPGFTG
jgi:hypothetical protein